MTWHILTTDPRREFAVAGYLVGHGVPVYCPTMQVKVRAAPITGKEWRYEDRPLFPGYLFAQLACGDAWKAIHCAAGCSGYLRGPEGPKLISDDGIAAVRRIEEELAKREPVRTNNPFSIGARVIIDQDGNPWTGLQGIVERLDKSERATLLLVLSGNAWRVQVPTECLRGSGVNPISPPRMAFSNQIMHEIIPPTRQVRPVG